MNNTQNTGYIAGLEGLRAFAIIFIVAYHFSFSWAGGGFLGVDIFFVLSGYLITSKILTIQETELNFNLKKFWSERLQRLLPTAYTMIFACVVLVLIFKRELLTTIWKDAVSSIFYTANWWFIFHKISYFDSFSTLSPLKHLWFLAVQEQFFFIWPIVLIVGLRFFKKRKQFLIIIFICALCSALLMGIMYNPDADQSRIYYGTDTRSFELLIGSFLGILLPLKKLTSIGSSIKQRNVINITSIFTFAVFILSAIFIDEYHAFLYRGGIFLFSLNSATLIVCVCHPSCFLGNILSWKPLRWIGSRSYGIYLWHYPIMVLSTPIYEMGNPVYWRVSVQLTITCIIAELTYRFLEMPIRKLGLLEFFRKYLSFSIFKWGRLTLTKKFSTIIVASVIATSVIVVLTFGVTCILKNEKSVDETESYPTEIIVSNIKQDVSYKDSKANSPEKNVTSPVKEDEASCTQKNVASPVKENEASSTQKNVESDVKKNETNLPSVNKSYKETLAIGDSIMIDIAPFLKRRFTNITIDGKVSRQLSDAIKLAPKYSKFNSTEDAIIIELGTNGFFSNKQIDSLLDSFSKAHIYLVNTRVPRSWEKKVNKVLKEKAEERENVELVDWYSTAVKHPEYFGNDAVHLKASGSEALTKLISDALNSK